VWYLYTSILVVAGIMLCPNVKYVFANLSKLSSKSMSNNSEQSI
jgi:hypothetical protein